MRPTTSVNCATERGLLGLMCPVERGALPTSRIVNPTHGPSPSATDTAQISTPTFVPNSELAHMNSKEKSPWPFSWQLSESQRYARRAQHRKNAVNRGVDVDI